MSELVLIFCLWADREHCIEHRHEPMPVMHCMAMVEPIADRFAVTHPGWRLVDWRCEKRH